MTHKFPLTELRHNFCSFSLIFFNFVHFTMPRGEHISLGDKGRIVALWQEGKSNHAIAKQFGLHHSMVGIFLKKFELLKVWKNITPAHLSSLYESNAALHESHGGSQWWPHQILSNFSLYFTILCNKLTYLQKWRYTYFLDSSHTASTPSL